MLLHWIENMKNFQKLTMINVGELESVGVVFKESGGEKSGKEWGMNGKVLK